MVWRMIECLLFLLAVKNTQCVGKLTATAFKTYPMLYFSEKEVTELRSRTSSSHEKIARDIRDAGQALTAKPEFYLPPKNYTVFASRWNEVYGNNLCAFAMYCFLYPQDMEALSLVKNYMDNMANYPDWYVAESYGRDEVPLGHSLIGFATAFDFLHQKLDSARRRKYYEAIKRAASTLYTVLLQNRHGWTKQYIHNHAASNIVAFLMGSLVVSLKEPKLASPWITEAKSHLDTAMEILKHVTDGSLDEGVSYGSYTSRGLTLYVFLAKRHLGIDHTKNPWLKRHFWFYYKTILPGFQRTVGIGDANHNWFYGPASQLAFLDNYVMKNGYGNWLASKIRHAKPKNKPLAPSNAGAMCMLHMEFIFYNSSIRQQKPTECPQKKLHIYSDWGVVTYGGGQDMKRGNTFLSFKSGTANGEAVESIMYGNLYPKKVNGWMNFNPGHEHPDHNSFIFAPNGRYFITEALYGPKLTFLDNTYSFAPSSTSQCNYPWEGQLGECSKWLRYKTFSQGMRGEILTATTSGDMVFIAGEAAGVYSQSLGISSYYRGVLLLNPEVLIVVDCIRLLPGSTTKLASATFQNMLHRFKPFTHLGYSGALVQYPEGSYKMFSIKVGGGPITLSLHEGVQPQYLREGPTNYINVTYRLLKDVTHVVHVFSGPNYSIKQAAATATRGYTGVSIKLNINGVEYVANISTVTKSRSKKLSAVKDRISTVGFAGYANVKIDNESHYFGFKNRSEEIKLHEFDTLSSNEEMIRSGKYTVTSLEKCQSFQFKLTSNKGIKMNLQDPNDHKDRRILLAYCVISMVFLVVMVVVLPKTNMRLFRKVRHNGRPAVIASSLLVVLVVTNLYCIDSRGYNTCVGRNLRRERLSAKVPEKQELPYPRSPFVFIASLPGFGGKLLESLFSDPNNFLPLSTGRKELEIPIQDGSSTVPNLCLWNRQHNKNNILATGWFTSLILHPRLHLNQLEDTAYVERLRRLVREHPNGAVALSDGTGFWATKLPWIGNVVGEENFLPLLLVRDPRSWIHAITDDKDRLRRRKTVLALTSAYDNIEKICLDNGLSIPLSVRRFKQNETKRDLGFRVTEKLATVWTVVISTVLSNEGGQQHSPRPVHVVRFEDLVRDAEATSSDIFSKIGFPLGIRYMNKLTRLVRSEFYSLPYDGIITPNTVDRWRTGLPGSEIQRINEICCPVMKLLNYKCN